MSLAHRKRHINRNTRAKKLVRDFYLFKEDCLNNDDMQALNRAIAEITDIINDVDNDEPNFFSEWSYIQSEDDSDDEAFSDLDIMPDVPEHNDILSPDEIKSLLSNTPCIRIDELPKLQRNYLCNHI